MTREELANLVLMQKRIDEIQEFYDFIERSWGWGPCLSVEKSSLRYPEYISLKIHNSMKELVKNELDDLKKEFEKA